MAIATAVDLKDEFQSGHLVSLLEKAFRKIMLGGNIEDSIDKGLYFEISFDICVL